MDTGYETAPSKGTMPQPAVIREVGIWDSSVARTVNLLSHSFFAADMDILRMVNHGHESIDAPPKNQGYREKQRGVSEQAARQALSNTN